MSSLRKCSFNQNYTPNCHIEEMRGGSGCVFTRISLTS